MKIKKKAEKKNSPSNVLTAVISSDGMNETNYSFITPSPEEHEKMKGTLMSVGIGAQVSWNIEKEAFIISFTFNFVNPNIGEKVFLSTTIANRFIIKDIKSHLTIYENKGLNTFDLDNGLMNLLVDISLNQSRGFLYARLKGTFLDKIALPIGRAEDFVQRLLTAKRSSTSSTA